MITGLQQPMLWGTTYPKIQPDKVEEQELACPACVDIQHAAMWSAWDAGEIFYQYCL